MISRSVGHRAEFFLFQVAKRSTPMMGTDRSSLSCRAILFLFVLFGIPTVARSATLEDAAKELARKIAAALPARENVSCEIRNTSSLQPGDVARIEQALKAELQDRGVRVSASIGATISVVVTLSENLKDFVWTGGIRQGDTSRVVFTVVRRSVESRVFSNAMPVMMRSEKFWEGPERILDAGEISDGVGKSWLVLLLPNGLLIQDRQTGSASTIEITSAQSASRDPWGNLGLGQIGNTIAFFLPQRVCTANLETRSLTECLPTEGPADGPATSRFPLMIDLGPAGPPPPGKGIELVIGSVCGGTNQFLATSARDYTQTDSVQAFQMESRGSIAISTELDFPGPIVALHTAVDSPRAIVRNLTTGNYEAYRLSISCGQ